MKKCTTSSLFYGTLFFALFLLNVTNISAQKNAILVFSIVDTNQHEINQDCKINASPIISKELLSDVKLNINYDAIEQFFVLEIPETYSGNIIQIDVQYQIGNKISTMQLFYKSASESDLSKGCFACMCLNIPFVSGKYVFDMPLQLASWELIPDVEKMLKGIQIKMDDITLLQNWRDQSIK